MGLEFKETEAVKFGDLVAMPKITPAQRLRLQQFDSKIASEEEWYEARDLAASCFGEHRDEVAKFIDAHFDVLKFTKLLAFLVAGEEGVEKIEKELQ